MGNRVSIKIQLDHGRDGDIPIAAGKRLKGKVILHVKRNVKPAVLKINFVGEESAMVSRRYGTKRLREKKQIARATTIVKDFRGRPVSRRIYTLPFQFLLPSSLPSTMEADRCSIHYFLVAEFGEYSLERSFNLTSAPLPPDIVPCLVQPTSHELRSLGILDKGYLTLGASVENSRVGRGQSLSLSLASRNDASVDIQRVRIKLVELIEYKAQDEHATVKVELGKVKDINLPGLKKERSKERRVRLRGHAENMAATYTEIYSSLMSGRNLVDVYIPESANDTYDGNLISISHYLKITFITKKVSMTANPVTKIPIVIGNEPESPTIGTIEMRSNHHNSNMHEQAPPPRQPSQRQQHRRPQHPPPPQHPRQPPPQQRHQQSRHQQQNQPPPPMYQPPRPPQQPLFAPRQRSFDAPVATIIFDDDYTDAESTIAVGSHAESAAVPMASALVLDPPPPPPEQRGQDDDNDDEESELFPDQMLPPYVSEPPRTPNQLPPYVSDPTPTPSQLPPYVSDPPRTPSQAVLISSQSTPSDDPEDSVFYDAIEVSPMIPSAPDENLVMNSPCASFDNDDDQVQENNYLPQDLDANRRPDSSQRPDSPQSPNLSYRVSSDAERRRLDSYSYAYSECSLETPDAMLQERLGMCPPSSPKQAAPPKSPPRAPLPKLTRSPESNRLLVDLMRELAGSVHDYEVVASKMKDTLYQVLFRTLTPDEYGKILQEVTMSHQVKVAVLLARQLAMYDSFTCEHCAAALPQTSEYFRSNMVETLLPFCNDLATHRHVIQNELTEWEQVVTSGAFQRALRGKTYYLDEQPPPISMAPTF